MRRSHAKGAANRCQTLRCHNFRVGGRRALMYNPDFPGKLGL
jgi:hypothetical protein